MNKTLRYILLLPFSLIYGIITGMRNWLYDIGILMPHKKNIPLLTIGNLTVGGTGKTPHVEFIVSKLTSSYKIAVLSRGYKRKTEGFLLADNQSDSKEIGDEPMQIYQKFSNVPVAVCEDRSEGIDRLVEKHKDIDLIILDDAFQHRKISAGLSVLLTDYNRLHTRDSLLPGGNLRESKSGSKRADIIIVTKCPPQIKPIEMRLIQHEVSPDIFHEVYFSTYKYEDPYPLFSQDPENLFAFKSAQKKNTGILLLTGIASPKMIISHIEKYASHIEQLNFDDHHEFSKQELLSVAKKFDKMTDKEKVILVTEKDAARLIKNKEIPDQLKYHIFVLPIRVKILNNKESSLIKKITHYVAENSGNS